MVHGYKNRLNQHEHASAPAPIALLIGIIYVYWDRLLHQDSGCWMSKVSSSVQSSVFHIHRTAVIVVPWRMIYNNLVSNARTNVLLGMYVARQ